MTHLCDASSPESDAKTRLNVVILRALMNAKGIKSVAELSRRTRERGSYVSKSTIFRLISGEVGGRTATGRSLARVLDTTVETLFAETAGE